MRCAAFFLLSLIAAGAAQARDAALIVRGEYVFRAAGCASCHTDTENAGKPLAGGRKLETPFGTFYSPNITPDLTTGIGRWREEDMHRALRKGRGPDGRIYYPVFPYTAYTNLVDDDIRALAAYLFAQPPVVQANKPHVLPWYLRFRPLIRVWQLIYMKRGPYRPNSERSARWNRGAYLATAALHCGECHTPRNRFGAPRKELYYAGNPQGPEGGRVPNITPDKATGIGRWSRSELLEYLKTGAMPDGDYAGDLMADVIDNSTSHLTQQDREAVVQYIFSLPPIEHRVGKETKRVGDEFAY